MVTCPISTRINVLLAELRELPEGLGTPVAAGLLVGDVLRCVGWSEAAIDALAPEVAELEVVAVGVVRAA
jgi:hypothetical protein